MAGRWRAVLLTAAVAIALAAAPATAAWATSPVSAATGHWGSMKPVPGLVIQPALTARYGGDAGYAGSASAATTLTVTK